MGLEIIIGPKSKNKSIYLYEKIKQDVENKNDVLFFVPSQKRVVTENEYMDYLNLDGIIDLKITTISEYIKKMINLLNIHYDDKYLTNIDKNIVVSKLVYENKDKLKKYNKVLDKDGFLLEISNYIDIFRNLDIKNEDIIKFNERTDVESATKEKLEELLFLYSKYLEEIENNKFVDDNSYIKLYNKINKKFPNTVYFDGYNNFKQIEYQVIDMFIKNGVDVVVSLVTDAKEFEDVNLKNTSEIFEIPNFTYTNLIKLASKYNVLVHENYIKYQDDKSQDLLVLGEYAFSDLVNVNNIDSKNIKINLVNNEKSEILSIANNIIESVKNGASFNDSVIYTSDIQKYENILKQVFYEYNIPFYIDKKESIENNVLVKYILLLIELLAKPYDTKLLLNILKLKLNDIDYNKLQILENYIIEYNMHDIRQEFIKSQNYDFEMLIDFRNELLNIFNLDTLNIKNKEVEVNFYIKLIYNHLIEKNILKNYECYINLVEDLYLKEVLVQVSTKLNDMFDSINKIYNKISYKKFALVIAMCVKEIKIDSIPSSINQVAVLDINSSKSNEKKFLYIVGANENEFPKEVAEDIIFNEKELERLNELNFKVKENTITKYNMGLYNIYEVFNIVKEKLVIYIKACNMSGKSLTKSRIVEKLTCMFNIKINECVLENEEEKYLSKPDILKYFFKAKNQEKKAIIDILKDDKNFINLLKWKKDDKNLTKNTLEKIYKNKITSSVTKLESFKKCPFSYYLKYILNVKKQEKFEITSLDLGTFMHSVIEEFSNYLLDLNILWHSLVIDEEFKKVEGKLEEIVNLKIDEILAKQKNGIKFNILKLKLINSIKSIVKVIARSFNQSQFKPYGYEIEFKEGALFAPIVIDIDNVQFELIGKIDRVDTLTIDDKMYVRVVDYKSSSKNLRLSDIKEGISLQLITYLSNFIKNIEKKEKLDVIPAAMTYFTISEKMLNLDCYLDEEEIKENIISSLRLKGIFLSDIDILNKMDKKFEGKERLIDISKMSISRKSEKCLDESEFRNLCKEAKSILENIAKELLSGVVKIAPNKKCDSCSYCDYELICRKNISV